MACMDSHLLQGYPREWRFQWDEGNFAMHLIFFLLLKIHSEKSMFYVTSQSNSSGHVSVIHHDWHFDPALCLRLEMTELPSYVKSAFTLFTVSFHP